MVGFDTTTMLPLKCDHMGKHKMMPLVVSNTGHQEKIPKRFMSSTTLSGSSIGSISEEESSDKSHTHSPPPDQAFYMINSQPTQRDIEMLLGVHNSRYCTLPPAEMLFYQTVKGDIKVYAHRIRVRLPLNETLWTDFGVKCKGPVVVVRLKDKRVIDEASEWNEESQRNEDNEWNEENEWNEVKHKPRLICASPALPYLFVKN